MIIQQQRRGRQRMKCQRETQDLNDTDLDRETGGLTNERSSDVDNPPVLSIFSNSTKRGDFIRSDPDSSSDQSHRTNPLFAKTGSEAILFSSLPIQLSAAVGFSLSNNFHGFQRLTVATFVATMLVAALQAGVALLQYRSNPQGQLVIPPGPTFGIEYPDSSNNSSLSSSSPLSWVHRQQCLESRSISVKLSSQAAAVLHHVGGGEEEEADVLVLEGNTADQSPTRVPSENGAFTPPLAYSGLQSGPSNAYQPETSPKQNQLRNRYGQLVKRINRFLVLLLPVFANNLYVLWLKYAHLLDIGIVLTLVRVVDSISRRLANWVWFPDRMKQDSSTSQCRNWQSFFAALLGPNGSRPIAVNGTNMAGASPLPKTQESSAKLPSKLKRVLVLGDSLAVGIGGIERFGTRTPPEKGLEYWLIENTDIGQASALSSPTSSAFLSLDDDSASWTSPVFPRVLASSLATKQENTVEWRSAGVDGGAISHIRELLLPVLQQEVEAGRSPDCVVILCGMNDLKLQFANAAVRPWRAFSAFAFRRELQLLFKEISMICSQCREEDDNVDGAAKEKTVRVILPSMPVQMFLKNTVVSIFPLVLFLDMIVGYWEGQKKRMADQYSRSCGSAVQIEYVPLSTKVVMEWYKRDEEMIAKYNLENNSPSLEAFAKGFVAADGIHPNAKCYAFWAEYVAETLLREQQQQWANETMTNEDDRVLVEYSASETTAPRPVK